MLWTTVAALATLSSCGVSQDEAVRAKDEAARLAIREAPPCANIGCFDENTFCAELFFEFGRSPPLCVSVDVCQQLECTEQGRKCFIFDGFPAEVRCVR